MTQHRLSDKDTINRTATCAVCGTDTPIQIHYHGRNRKPVAGWACANKRKESAAKFRDSHRAELNTAARQYYRIGRHHHLTPEEYDARLVGQGGGCAVCGCTPTYKLHVDHDHKCCPGQFSCGKCVRGLLCIRCNNLLGSVRDNPELLMEAAAYIKKTEGTVERMV